MPFQACYACCCRAESLLDCRRVDQLWCDWLVLIRCPRNRMNPVAQAAQRPQASKFAHQPRGGTQARGFRLGQSFWHPRAKVQNRTCVVPPPPVAHGLLHAAAAYFTRFCSEQIRTRPNKKTYQRMDERAVFSTLTKWSKPLHLRHKTAPLCALPSFLGRRMRVFVFR